MWDTISPDVLRKDREWSQAGLLRIKACVMRRLGDPGGQAHFSHLYLWHFRPFFFRPAKQRTGSEELVDKSPREVTVGSLIPIGRHDPFLRYRILAPLVV